MKRRSSIRWIASFGLVALGGCNRGPKFTIDDHAGLASYVVDRFTDTAYASYRTAWKEAEKLRASANAFLAQPSAQGMVQLRDTWIKAHEAFAETEALRLPGSPNHPSNPNSPYPRVGLWPVNPTDLDTVPGTLRTGLVHDTSKAAQLSQEILLESHKPGDGTITMGFHALEFMIFGFDQYDDGNGTRAFIDYSLDKQAKRRSQLLYLLVENLTADLQDMLAAWHPSNKGNHRDIMMSQPRATALAGILAGLTDLCASGLNETLTKALATGNPNDTWCAFSDNSIASLEHTIIGMQNVVFGNAADRAVDETRKPLLELIAKADPTLATQIESGLNSLVIKFRSMGKPMDQLVKPDNADGRARLEAAAAAVAAQGVLFEKASNVLRLQG